MVKKRLLGSLLMLSLGSATIAADPLPANSARLYKQAQSGHWYSQASKLQPTLYPTSDGQSFAVVWKACPSPQKWIVSLHGSRGFATDDLAVWYPHLKDRPVGLVCLQWWLGRGDDTRNYYAPLEIYREIDQLLQKLNIQPGQVMFEGFSRGSANAYAVAAIDSGLGRHFFALSVAQSGGVAEDYPPTRAILDGEFGDHPLRGTRWVTVAGGRDPEPERDGIPAMRRTAKWLETQGAIVVELIEDSQEGHGALHRSAANSRRLLDLFLK